jgi:hypothetical protein
MKPDKIYLSLSVIILLAVFSWVTSCTHVANIANIPEICFTSDILPIFSSNCAISGCHDGGGGADSHMALNSYAEISRRVTPGNPNGSSLYQAIIAKWANRMPPNKPLSLENREKIRIWIEQGAPETTCTDTTGNTGNTGNTGGTYVARACFSRDILPVIVSKCGSTGCHDATTHREGYNYTTYTNILSSVTPGNPTASRLYKAMTTATGESKMPPSGSPQMTTAEKDSINHWIAYGALNENCGEVCDTISPVTFSKTIWPIMQASCSGCHSGTSPSGNVLLASYNNVATIASNGTLMNSLKGAGVTKMPVGSTFSTCRIRQFQIWVNNGYLNN